MHMEGENANDRFLLVRRLTNQLLQSMSIPVAIMIGRLLHYVSKRLEPSYDPLSPFGNLQRLISYSEASLAAMSNYSPKRIYDEVGPDW